MTRAERAERAAFVRSLARQYGLAPCTVRRNRLVELSPDARQIIVNQILQRKEVNSAHGGKKRRGSLASLGMASCRRGQA